MPKLSFVIIDDPNMKVDYESNTPKKIKRPELIKKIIRSEIRGSTLVTRVIDRDYEVLVTAARYGGGID